MRAWLPERQVYGPEPAGERDTEGLNRVFADAFTDRYRRDGLVGVRVPHLNPQVWRYALLDAGPGAMLWRDEAGHVVAFNIAHRADGARLAARAGRGDPGSRDHAPDRGEHRVLRAARLLPRPSHSDPDQRHRHAWASEPGAVVAA